MTKSYAETIQKITEITGSNQTKGGGWFVDFYAQGYCNNQSVVLVCIFLQNPIDEGFEFNVMVLSRHSGATLTSAQTTHLSSLLTQASYMAQQVEDLVKGKTWSEEEVMTHWEEKEGLTRVE